MHAGVQRCLQYGESPVSVHPVSYKRPGDGPCDRPGSSLMEHDLDASDCLTHEFLVGNIALDEFHPPIEFSRRPVEKSSKTRTAYPSPSNRAAKLDPMKPAPPVTRTFTVDMSP